MCESGQKVCLYKGWEDRMLGRLGHTAMALNVRVMNTGCTL